MPTNYLMLLVKFPDVSGLERGQEGGEIERRERNELSVGDLWEFVQSKELAQLRLRSGCRI